MVPVIHIPSSTDVRHGDDASEMVHEDNATDTEGGRDRDVESSVPV